MSTVTNLILVSGFTVVIALLLAQFYMINEQHSAVISLINGTSGVYDKLDTITKNTEELHPSQDTICLMLNDEICEHWQYLQDNPTDTEEDALNASYYWHDDS